MFFTQTLIYKLIGAFKFTKSHYLGITGVEYVDWKSNFFQNILILIVWLKRRFKFFFDILRFQWRILVCVTSESLPKM